MAHFAECFLLLVRSSDDVSRACREANAFLAFQEARLAAAAAPRDRKLVGIWLDPELVDAPPEVWTAISTAGTRKHRIGQSVGVSGVWSLCWLDAEPACDTVDMETLRESLVSSLIDETVPSLPPGRLRFVPVFDAADDHDSVLRRTERLRERFPGLIGDPMRWKTCSAGQPH